MGYNPESFGAAHRACSRHELMRNTLNVNSEKPQSTVSATEKTMTDEQLAHKMAAEWGPQATFKAFLDNLMKKN